MFVAIYVGYDLPLSFLGTSGANVEFKEEILLVLGLLLLVINIRRTVRRWMGLRLVNQTEKFKWNSIMSRERIRRVIVYTMMEALIMLVFALILYIICPEAWMPLVGLLWGVIDNIVFTIYGTTKHKFRIGLTSKALLSADRDVIVIYFTGLRKVSKHQQTIYFDFIQNLQLSYPEDCVKEDERSSFYCSLKESLNLDKVFFSDNLA